jgi:hypothetical protein
MKSLLFRKLKFQRLVFFPVINLLCLYFSIAASADEKPVSPFGPGEVIEYTLRWGAVGVGKGRLEVREMTEVNGQPAHHFVLSVRTNSWADTFYRVRSEFESFIAEDFSRSLKYVSRQAEGRRERFETLIFDWEDGMVRTFDAEGELKEETTLEGPVFDPLGMLFAFRRTEFFPGQQHTIYATDGRRAIDVDVVINNFERTRVPAGRFETILVEPETKELRGVFARSRDSSIQLWYSRDERQIPILMRGEVAVGSFRALMTDYTPGLNK